MGTELIVSAYPDKTTDEETRNYVSVVQFMARWFEKQDGAHGLSTEELFDEFKSNVCEVMKGDAVPGD